MRFLSFALGGLLAAVTLPARAQTSADAPAAPLPGTARYYVGLGAYSSYYQQLGRLPAWGRLFASAQLMLCASVRTALRACTE